MKLNFTLFFLLFSLVFWAQEPVSIHLTETDGLPDREFYALAEDNDGIIWLAGNKGLTRYDGTEFITLEHPEKRGLSLFNVIVDSKNRVWTVNISGQVFYAENSEMHLFADLKDKFKGNLASFDIVDNTLVVATYFEIMYFDLEKNLSKSNIRRNKFDVYIQPKNVNGKLLYGGKGGIVEVESINEKNKSIIKEFSTHKKNSFYTGQGQFQSLSDTESLIVFQGKQFKKIFYTFSNLNAIKEIEIPKELEKIRISTTRRIDNIIWFNTANGAFRYTYANNKLTLVSQLLVNTFTTDVIKDRDNNYWISTLEDGVYVLPNIAIKTLAFNKNLGKPTRIAYGKKNELLVGFTKGNTIAYNIKDNNIINFNITKPEKVSSLAYNKFTNSYIISMQERSYELFLPSFKAVKLKTLNNVKDIQFIENTTAIIASSNTISIQDYRIQDNSGFIKQYNTRGYTCLYDAKTKTTYLAQANGLVSLDSLYNKTNIFDASGKEILTQNLVQAQNGTVWAASFQNGIYKINGNKVENQLVVKDGLLSNRINAIGIDGDYLWISTDSGIQRYTIETGEFRNLLLQDGVPNYSIRDIVVAEDAVFFGSTTEVFRINKKDAFKDFKLAPIYISEFNLNGVEANPKIKQDLKQKNSEMSLTFNANGFRAMSSGIYDHKLDGFDKNWIKVPRGSNLIQFPSLPLGNYKLVIRGRDTQGNETFTQPIVFTVSLPFYKTTWFGVFIFILIFASVVYYYNSKLRSRENEKNKELKALAIDNELINLRLENLRSQMNPHFIFNALNSIHEYIVGNERDLASSYLVKFAKLIRMYLDQSRENQIPLTLELEAMTLYLELEQIRYENKLTYTLDVNVNEDKNTILVPPLFIQPYVENALKHGLLHKKNDRILNITFTYDKNNVLHIEIKDNGVGRAETDRIQKKRSGNHKSFASNANNQRVALLNKGRTNKITVAINDLEENENALGTQVLIKIPQNIIE